MGTVRSLVFADATLDGMGSCVNSVSDLQAVFTEPATSPGSATARVVGLEDSVTKIYTCAATRLPVRTLANVSMMGMVITGVPALKGSLGKTVSCRLVPAPKLGLRAGMVECAGMQMDLPPALCADAWQDLWALVVRWMLMTA